MNTTNIFKQFTKNTVGKFTRIKFTKNGTIRKITGIAAIISIMAGTTACGNRTEAVITDNNEDITSYKEYATVEESKASKLRIYMAHRYQNMSLQKKTLMPMRNIRKRYALIMI